jgi:ABC-2 type transport system ATP-binding protein
VEGRTVAEGAIADLVRASGHQARFRLRLRADPPDGAPMPNTITIVARQGAWWTVDLDPSTTPDEAWRMLLFSGWPVVEVREDGGGLEALYLSLVEGRQP